MPTYDYLCDACGHAFELRQSMTANKKRKCPDCGKPKLRRLIGSGAAVLFKGSGFYETDYKRKAPSTSKSKPKSDSDTSSSSKSDSSSSDTSSPKSDTGAKKKKDTGKSDAGKSGNGKSKD